MKKIPNQLTPIQFQQVVDVFVLLAKWRDQERQKNMRSLKSTQVESSNQFSTLTTDEACDTRFQYSDRTVTDARSRRLETK